MARRTPEEILDYHLHKKGIHGVSVSDRCFYDASINAIKEALTIDDSICNCGTEKHCLTKKQKGLWVCGKCKKPY